MPTKDERVVVDWSDGSGGGCSDMCKTCCCGGVAADTVEVCIIGRRLAVLVNSRPFTTGVTELSSGLSVPCYSKAVDVKESITKGNFFLGGPVVEIVRD